MENKYQTRMITASTLKLLTVQEAKQQCRITEDDDAHNADLSTLIDEVTDFIESLLNRSLLTSTRELHIATFGTGEELLLPFAPLQSVTFVKYYDEDNVQQTLSSSRYFAITDDRSCGSVYLHPDYEWPETFERPDAVQIRFVCGWTSAANVPAGIRKAAKMLLAHWFENREAVADRTFTEVPLAFETLMKAYLPGDAYSWFGPEG